jgi:predicted acylesterase/phospholipase RssA
MIQHLVLSGGGVWGLAMYGILRESHNSLFWNIDNIKTMYCTSVGSIMAVMLSLKYEWDTMDDFLIKRPWEQVFPLNIDSIVSSFDRRGIFDEKCMSSLFESLFKGKDLSLNITMKELYEYTHIDIHCFSTEINNETHFVKTDFSYKTHPDWKVVDVVYCSSCLPVLFAPFLFEGGCYIDGVFTSNYPLLECLSEASRVNMTRENETQSEETLREGEEVESIVVADTLFGIKKKQSKKKSINYLSSLFEYVFHFMTKFVATEANETAIKHQIDIVSDETNLYEIFSVASSQEERVKLIDKGVEEWAKFKEKMSPTNG